MSKIGVKKDTTNHDNPEKIDGAFSDKRIEYKSRDAKKCIKISLNRSGSYV